MLGALAGTPRNTAATEADAGETLKAVRAQQSPGSKLDIQGNLLQSFKSLDVMTGSAGTPRSTANTGQGASVIVLCG